MTEQQFQEARKVMKTANWMRGEITTAKGEVARWTAIEQGHRENLRHTQAEGAKKMLEKAIEYLAEKRKRFADLQLPGQDFKPIAKWVCAIDVDSYNLEPKEINEDQFEKAREEGLVLFDTKADAQQVCDKENSL